MFKLLVSNLSLHNFISYLQPMDTLEKARRVLKKKYKRIRFIWLVEDNGGIMEFFQVEEKGKKHLKLLVFISQSKETIIYDLKMEELVKKPK